MTLITITPGPVTEIKKACHSNMNTSQVSTLASIPIPYCVDRIPGLSTMDKRILGSYFYPSSYVYAGPPLKAVSEECGLEHKETLKAAKKLIERRLLAKTKSSYHLNWDHFPRPMISVNEHDSRFVANNMRYRDYLKTPHWKGLRSDLIQLMFEMCQRCGSDNLLHVHHKTYQNLGCELWGDLEVLCNKCHHLEHTPA